MYLAFEKLKITRKRGTELLETKKESMMMFFEVKLHEVRFD